MFWKWLWFTKELVWYVEVKAEISDLDKKEVVVDEGDDDDFGEIVELETQVLPVKEEKPSIESVIQHNLDSSIEKVLKLCPGKSQF